MIDKISSGSAYSDDGFAVTAAEPWLRSKVAILQQYISAFVAHVSGKANDIILVDLFSGNGLFSLGSQKELFAGNALATLGQELPITKYVFCERGQEHFRTLKIRVNRYFRGKNVVLLEGIPEELLDKFRLYVPQSKGDYRSAVLCLCDPFSLDIPFELLDKLAEMDFNFLIPYTFALNDRINYRHYLNDGRHKVVKFLGTNRDTEALEKELDSNLQFYKRMVQVHEQNLLGSGMNGAISVHKLDSGLMEMPWYYVGLYSRQFSTKAVQQDVEAARNVQFELFGG